MKSKRLQIISELIEPSDRLADIGCDHGYLGAYSLLRGISYLQLIDNKEGPLSSAIHNLKGGKLNCEIEFTLSDGLTELSPQVDTIAICGMGGELIISILDKGMELAKKMKKIILQPNTKIEEVRQFLTKMQFTILEEKMVKEKGKIYEVMVTKFQKNASLLSIEDCYFGPILRKERNPLFIEKHSKRISHIETILSSSKSDDDCLEELKTELKMLKKEVEK